MSTNTHYPDERRAEALAALISNDGNVSGTARLLGIPESTLRYFAKHAEGEQREQLLRLREGKQLALAEKFEQLAENAVGVAEAKLGEASAKDAAIVAGIATDKMQVLRGQASVITASDPPQVARLEELRALFSALEGQRAAVTVTATTVTLQPRPVPITVACTPSSESE